MRVAVALAAVAFALLRIPAPWGLIGAVSAVGLSLTGFLGYCPACAMVGRKI